MKIRITWRLLLVMLWASVLVPIAAADGPLPGNGVGDVVADEKRGRFLLLKRSTRVCGKARAKLNAVLASLGAKPSRAWELKESFRRFWLYRSLTWTTACLKAWTTRAMRSRLEPMKKVARMLRAHEELLLNYFRAKRPYNSGVVEGLNNKARVSLAHSYGHRSSDTLKLVLYNMLGKLHEPPSPYKFC